MFIGACRHKQGERDWDPRDESEGGDEDEEAELVGGDGGLVDDEVDMEDEVVAGRIGQYSIDKVKNEMTEGELEHLRLEYGIPDTIKLRLLRKDEKASQPPDGSVLIHSGFFKYGFRLPLHPYVHKFLRTLGLAPMQMNPNVYIAWLSMYVLWKQLGLGEPSFAQFANQYCLKKHPSSIGWWYVCAFMNIEGALITNNSSKKAWKNKYFFASGNWKFREGDVGSGARVQTCFRRAGGYLHVM
ncbi:hypothetical protein L3X38_011601 [Prunus dulcis]|uniref:Transposase (putative) gypsy type domain-containing protein n=1 Tax=Prunus dulcis TaxID=3755 RepID=A0AAD4WHU6_PRUDU|nr:hypothetical protein L3X38_011601 [Prunus dulcis]